MLKRCTICKVWLLVDEFTHNRSRKDGLEAYCKACNLTRQQKYRAENPDRIRQVVYRSMKRNWDKVLARFSAAWYHPIRQVCSIAGCNSLGERHHPNYEERAQIVWLCRKHHRALDKG